jgi:predicted transcriptional regulator
MDKKYSQYVIDLCENKSAISLSQSKQEIVSKLLDETSFLNSLTPTYSLRIYCVKNNIHDIPKCEHCGGNTSVNARNNKLGFNRFCSDLCRQSTPRLNKNIMDKLKDKDWLYTQRIVNKKSKENIANELGVSHPTISKWISKHGIKEIQYNCCQVDLSNTLEQYDWLYEKYILEQYSSSDISSICGCGTGIVLKYIKQYGIPIRNGTENQLSKNSIEKLSNKDWLYKAYATNWVSMDTIALELGCSQRTIRNYLNRHNIPVRSGSETRLGKFAWDLLNDKDWMYEQYVTNKLSTYDICIILKCTDSCVSRYLNGHGIQIRIDNTVSTYEYKIRDYLDSLDVTYEYSTKQIISPYELDIIIPEKNIAFEINGVYWHSEVYKLSTYHKMKTDMCSNLGIRLIHIYEDDIVNRFDIVKRFIKNSIGKCDDIIVFARKCNVLYNVGKEFLTKFFVKYHIQGYAVHSYNVCLEYNGEIVAAMLFNGNILTRYTTSCKVVGGLSKLVKNSKLDIIHTFVDLQMFTGESYLENGFYIVDRLPVDYTYVHNDERKHKFGFRKNRFKNDPKLKYDETMTEHELAIYNRIYRIYDCGKLKLEWRKK